MDTTTCIRYDVWQDGWHGGWCLTHDTKWSTDFGHCDRMPEWRRRSLEGRGRFDAVADMTDRVAGR